MPGTSGGRLACSRCATSTWPTARACVALQGVSLRRAGRARRWRSSGPTAPARPRCSRPSPGWCRPGAARSGSTAAASTTSRPPDRVGLGIALVPEGRRLFSRLTVAENLSLGTFRDRDPERRAGDARARLRPLPRAARAGAAACGDALGRRGPDALDRPRPHVAAALPHAGRAEPRHHAAPRRLHPGRRCARSTGRRASPCSSSSRTCPPPSRRPSAATCSRPGAIVAGGREPGAARQRPGAPGLSGDVSAG